MTIAGMWTAIATPLDNDLQINHRHLATLANDLLESSDGIVLFGSTGEAPSFSIRERKECLAQLIANGVAPERVVVGTGCTSLPDTLELTTHATATKVAGVLVVPPFYFKGVPDEGVVASYTQLVHAAGPNLRLYLYHFPKLSGVPLTPKVASTLRQLFPDTVLGIKDSTGDIESVRQFLEIDGLAVFPGTERLLTQARTEGAAGVITATGNVNAPNIATVWRGGPDEAPMLAVREAVERFGTIMGAKAVLADRYEDEGWNRVRPPLVALDADERAELRRSLAMALPTPPAAKFS